MTLFDTTDDRAARQISLVRLSGEIAHAVGSVGRVAVEGEVHKVSGSQGGGRLWFTLRDRASQVSVSVPSSRRSRCRAVAGERVCVTGRLEWVPGWGQVQLVAEEVVPVGSGAIAQMIAEARARLRADGLVDRERRPLPMLPRVIGVVCGRDAAVRADIESVVAARFPGYPVRFLETTVSGPGAAASLVEALALLDGAEEVDVIVLARGGGDATQLLPFSDEELCRAVCATSTPVVAAIGHDGDRPLVDEVADVRCGTPSLAAGAVVPDKAALVARLDGLLRGADAAAAIMVGAAAGRLERIDRRRAAADSVPRASARLLAASEGLALMHPSVRLAGASARLAAVDWQAPTAGRVAAAAERLGGLVAHVEALSPAAVLARGYAVVRAAGGAVVRDVVAAGETVDVTVAGGRFSAVVTS